MKLGILLVDDEPDAVTLFQQQFRREIRKGDYIFDFAHSADEAMHVIARRELPTDIVILSDINMPGRSGLELLADVRERWPDVPVFMITAYGDPDTEKRAIGLGATDFLHKPVDFSKLKERIRQMRPGA